MCSAWLDAALPWMRVLPPASGVAAGMLCSLHACTHVLCCDACMRACCLLCATCLATACARQPCTTPPHHAAPRKIVIRLPPCLALTAPPHPSLPNYPLSLPRLKRRRCQRAPLSKRRRLGRRAVRVCVALVPEALVGARARGALHRRRVAPAGRQQPERAGSQPGDGLGRQHGQALHSERCGAHPPACPLPRVLCLGARVVRVARARPAAGLPCGLAAVPFHTRRQAVQSLCGGGGRTHALHASTYACAA